MSPALTLVLLFSGWLAVAAAMLWGVMRISRRHHPQIQPKQDVTSAKRLPRPVNVH